MIGIERRPPSRRWLAVGCPSEKKRNNKACTSTAREAPTRHGSLTQFPTPLFLACHTCIAGPADPMGPSFLSAFGVVGMTFIRFFPLDVSVAPRAEVTTEQALDVFRVRAKLEEDDRVDYDKLFKVTGMAAAKTTKSVRECMGRSLGGG